MFNGVLGSIFFTAYVEDILPASKFEYCILPACAGKFE